MSYVSFLDENSNPNSEFLAEGKPPAKEASLALDTPVSVISFFQSVPKAHDVR